MDEEENSIKFRVTINRIGGSVYFAMPKHLLEYLGLDIKDEIELIPKFGKHGKYVAFWKKREGTPSEEEKNIEN